MPGKFRYRVKYRIIRKGTIEVSADNDMEAGNTVDEAALDGELQPDDTAPEVEILDVSCLDTGNCSKCGAEESADLLAHTGGVCRGCRPSTFDF